MSDHGLGAMMPYTVGLAPATRIALRRMAEAEGVTPTVLVRRILEEATETLAKGATNGT